jgi:hypothetical protein
LVNPINDFSIRQLLVLPLWWRQLAVRARINPGAFVVALRPFSASRIALEWLYSIPSYSVMGNILLGESHCDGACKIPAAASQACLPPSRSHTPSAGYERSCPVTEAKTQR